MSTITYKLQEQETQAFWQAIANKTNCLVKLSLATYVEGHNRILNWTNLNNNQPLPPKNAFPLLQKIKAWYRNIKNKESVLWKFDKQQQYNIVIVDDLQEIEQFKRKDHLLLWKTSQGKYQAAFLLDKYVDDETVKKIQKVLIDVYRGDGACKGASHALKMPGFFNTKYPDPPYIKLLHVGEGILSIEQALQYYRKNIEPKEYKPKDLRSLPRLLTYRELDKRKKDWWYFYNLKGDKSAADFAYAKYLMNFNLTDEDIKQILLSESDDIQNRKRGHLEDYLERTVVKARKDFVPFGEEN